MDASVVEFVGSSFANVDDFDVKMEGFPSQRMIGIDVDVFVADVDDPKGERFTVFGFCRHTSADFKHRSLGENRFWNGLWFALAQSIGIFWGDIDVESVADGFSVEGFFESWQDLTMPVHISHGIVARRQIEDFAGIVAHDEDERCNGIVLDGIRL